MTTKPAMPTVCGFIGRPGRARSRTLSNKHPCRHRHGQHDAGDHQRPIHDHRNGKIGRHFVEIHGIRAPAEIIRQTSTPRNTKASSCAAVFKRYDGARPKQVIDEVDDDVLAAQENVGNAQENGADQEQLHQVVGAGDRQVERRARNVTSATVMSIIAARKSALP